jgi:hypothetical protein
MIFFQSAGFFGNGVVGELLSNWEQMGLFSYLLPFLLLFALIFGILTKVNIFKDNKTVNGIIALAVALMALQFGFVTQFFSEIFPRVGVGLAILLGLIILVGLFMDPESNMINYILLSIGAIIVIVVLVQSASALGLSYGNWWKEYWTSIAGIVLVLIVIGAILGSHKPKEKEPYRGMWTK